MSIFSRINAENFVWKNQKSSTLLGMAMHLG